MEMAMQLGLVKAPGDKSAAPASAKPAPKK